MYCWGPHSLTSLFVRMNSWMMEATMKPRKCDSSISVSLPKKHLAGVGWDDKTGAFFYKCIYQENVDHANLEIVVNPI